MGLPTLSQIQGWDTDHLVDAADHWSASADYWETAFTQAWQEAHNVSWEGHGANALRERASADKTTVAGHADQLREVAAIARRGAGDIGAAQRKVLYAIEEANNAGFRVDEDLCVIDKRISRNAGQRAARRVQVQAFSADIRSRAAQLEALDSEVATNITGAGGGIGTDVFGKSGEGRIQAVDNRVHPHDDPFNERIEPPPYKAPDGQEWHWYTGGKGWQLEAPLKQCDGVTEYRDLTGAIAGIILAPLSIPGAIGGVLAGPGAIVDLTHCQPPGGTH